MYSEEIYMNNNNKTAVLKHNKPQFYYKNIFLPISILPISLNLPITFDGFSQAIFKAILYPTYFSAFFTAFFIVSTLPASLPSELVAGARAPPERRRDKAVCRPRRSRGF